MSSLREDIKKVLQTAYSPDTYSEWRALDAVTDAIMSAVDSHIPEKTNVLNMEIGLALGTSAAHGHLMGFNEAVDLMREEMK